MTVNSDAVRSSLTYTKAAGAMLCAKWVGTWCGGRGRGSDKGQIVCCLNPVVVGWVVFTHAHTQLTQLVAFWRKVLINKFANQQ